MTVGLNVIIYSKALRFSVLNNKKFSVGQLINVMQVDANKFNNLADYVAGVLFLPIRLVIGIFLMYSLVGMHFMSGLGVMILVCIINYFQGKALGRNSRKIMEASDERMKATNETINGIKLIKMNAWEGFFQKRVRSIIFFLWRSDSYYRFIN
jgi:ATP-binding cassette subfamily C (CFTR/MRP) protein 1